MVGIRDSLSGLASSDNGEDGEDENDEETEQGKLSEDDEPGWVMGTITKPVQQHMKRFWKKQMKFDKLTQPGWGDAADDFLEVDTKSGISELRVPAIVKLQTDDDAAAPALTTFWEPMEWHECVPGLSQVPQGTYRPGSSHIGLGLVKPQSNTTISGLQPAAERDTSPLSKAKSVEPVSFHPCI